jgi:hypothetical protein
MNVERCERTIASPTIPGIARRRAAEAQCKGAMRNTLRMITTRMALTSGDARKLIQ